jgi:hypothetical protein
VGQRFKGDVGRRLGGWAARPCWSRPEAPRRKDEVGLVGRGLKLHWRRSKDFARGGPIWALGPDLGQPLHGGGWASWLLMVSATRVTRAGVAGWLLRCAIWATRVRSGLQGPDLNQLSPASQAVGKIRLWHGHAGDDLQRVLGCSLLFVSYSGEMIRGVGACESCNKGGSLIILLASRWWSACSLSSSIWPR